jgi:pyrimidine-nucleoside phosphorylase
MRAIDVIARKRDGHELSQAEIDYFVQAYTRGEIPDYQAAAWLMAIYLNGMSDRETSDLTLSMARSGDRIHLGDTVPTAVDKHSTGGVGDKVSLIVAPLVAACGLPVAKITGRGLGFTGGTLDKLESIPGLRIDLEQEAIRTQLGRVGVVLTGPTANLAPADGKLYALRDTTATVGSPPLIVSSILSKKVAGGATAVVLDVKVGSGALMRRVDDGLALAQSLVTMADEVGLRAVALVSDMNQPLGRAVGNALEVEEAIATLRGAGPEDLLEHCLVVAGEMLALGGAASSASDGREAAAQALTSGAGWVKFREFVGAQGGDVSTVDFAGRLPVARLRETVRSPQGGYLAAVDAAAVGNAVVALGGGRATKSDSIDHAVGIVVHRRVGDEVAAGDVLFTVHANDRSRLLAARKRVLDAHAIGPDPTAPLPLFYARISGVAAGD